MAAATAAADVAAGGPLPRSANVEAGGVPGTAAGAPLGQWLCVTSAAIERKRERDGMRSLNANWNLNEAAAGIPRMARKHQEICTQYKQEQ